MHDAVLLHDVFALRAFTGCRRAGDDDLGRRYLHGECGGGLDGKREMGVRKKGVGPGRLEGFRGLEERGVTDADGARFVG